MKRVYVIVPIIAMMAFAGYYAFWRIGNGPTDASSARDEYANRDGAKEAQAAIDDGQLVILTYGLPAEWSHEYREVLLKDYGIQLRAIAGCEVTQPLLDFAANYNRVMRDRIKKSFEADVFDAAVRDAKTLYNQRLLRGDAHPASVPSSPEDNSSYLKKQKEQPNHAPEPTSPSRGGSS